MDRIIFLDAEFADNQELLELSIYNLASEEIYHSYFKPTGITRWPDSMAIHHITPQDVADSPSFASQRRIIQGIIDNATHIGGFAVDGDISHLETQGIRNLDSKCVIELKDMFWLYMSETLGGNYYSFPGL